MGHTPGPWEVCKHYHADGNLWLSVNQSAVQPSPMKEWIAEIKYLCTDPERQWANALLIAAAPDLLVSLKEMRDVAAAMMRVIVMYDASIAKDFGHEVRAIGIKNGFGVRADNAIARAEPTT